MYRDKEYFKEFLKDITDLEKESLQEVLRDLGLAPEDLSAYVKDLEDKIEDLESELEARGEK